MEGLCIHALAEDKLLESMVAYGIYDRGSSAKPDFARPNGVLRSPETICNIRNEDVNV